MPKLTAPLMSFQAHGKVADAVVYTGQGPTSRARAHVPKADARTWPQFYHRWDYASYCAWWNTLTPTQKDVWRVQGNLAHNTAIGAWLANRLATKPDQTLTLHLDSISAGQVLDEGPNANHGTLFGPILVAAKYRDGLSFDGVDDYVDFGAPDSLDLTESNFTLLLWLYPTAAPANYRTILGTTAGAENGAILLGLLEDTRFKLDFYANALVSSGPLAENTWHHLAATYNAISKQRTLYYNGVQDTQDISPANPNVSGDTWRLGANPIDGPVKLTGIVDEVRILNRLLTPAEIANHANRPTP